jgi:hypothetical protein
MSWQLWALIGLTSILAVVIWQPAPHREIVIIALVTCIVAGSEYLKSLGNRK